MVEMVPVDAAPPVTLLTCHVTTVLLEPVTVAWNCCVPLAGTVAVVGAIAIITVCVLPPEPPLMLPPLPLLLPIEPPPQEIQDVNRTRVITEKPTIRADRPDMGALKLSNDLRERR